MKTIVFRVLFMIVMPWFLVACDDSSGGGTAGGSKEESKDTHVSLAKEYFGYLKQAKEGLESLRDAEAVSSFVSELEKVKPQLEDLVRRAMALPEPTEEEKELIEKMDKELTEGVSGRVVKADEAPGLMATKSIAPKPPVVSVAEKLEEVTSDFRKIYRLGK